MTRSIIGEDSCQSIRSRFDGRLSPPRLTGHRSFVTQKVDHVRLRTEGRPDSTVDAKSVLSSVRVVAV